ncbi:MAG TPA: NRDE family protein [Planctomycetota bacterium]|nr:NRDE family protein [Planctomycetota bacterium]
MCTVTFLPGLPRGGWLLATNRDESPRRLPALAPYATEIGGRLVLAPRDADAGGTWIGVDEQGFALTILNGDRPAAAPPPEDPVSRGRLVLELLERRDADAVCAELRRRGLAGELRYRPFKLVVVEPGRAGAAAALRRAEWDGRALSLAATTGPQCITSSTLEPDAVAEVRCAAFGHVLEAVRPHLREDASAAELDALAAALHDFHASHRPQAPGGDALSVCMHRPEARTVSSTLVLVGPQAVRMDYQPGWPCQDGELHVAELARP